MSEKPATHYGSHAVTHDMLVDLHNRIVDKNTVLREMAFRPGATPPQRLLSVKEASEMLGIPNSSFASAVIRHQQKLSEIYATKKQLTLEDAHHVQALMGRRPQRPEGTAPMVIAGMMAKGGVGKTSLTVALAMAIAAAGWKTLLIDTDGQGSATRMLGIAPEFDVEPNDTIVGLFDPKGEVEEGDLFQGGLIDLSRLPRATHWHGLDIIPGGSALYEADSNIARSWGVEAAKPYLDRIEASVRRLDYDFIFFDTPPAMSFMGMVLSWITRGIVLPVPPGALELHGCGVMYRLLSETFQSFSVGRPAEKVIEMLAVVINREGWRGASLQGARMVRQTMGHLVLPEAIPESLVVGHAALSQGTVMDLTKGVKRGSLQRIRDAYMQVGRRIELLTADVWACELQRAQAAPADRQAA